MTTAVLSAEEAGNKAINGQPVSPLLLYLRAEFLISTSISAAPGLHWVVENIVVGHGSREEERTTGRVSLSLVFCSSSLFLASSRTRTITLRNQTYLHKDPFTTVFHRNGDPTGTDFGPAHRGVTSEGKRYRLGICMAVTPHSSCESYSTRVSKALLVVIVDQTPFARCLVGSIIG